MKFRLTNAKEKTNHCERQCEYSMAEGNKRKVIPEMTDQSSK